MRIVQYPPLTLANTFLTGPGNGCQIEHMKLQKLSYYAYGWWLGYRDDPLLTEDPEVWQYGPVFESLYSAMKPFGSRPIPGPQAANPFAPPQLVPQTDTDVHGLISWVWNRYGGSSGLTLSDETHKPGTPWQVEAEKHNYRVPRHYKIPVETTKAFFRAEAAKLAAG